jgi:hypothetical protein
MEVKIDLVENQTRMIKSLLINVHCSLKCGRGAIMKILLIEVDPQGSRGSDTAGTPQHRTDYYLS